ncbi:MAG: hypothetical protein HQL22_10850, partial [Candidatus Omnitrophica bacterium]|nr:hypothetical protein [Candidatus Omnitrophota bacterium]
MTKADKIKLSLLVLLLGAVLFAAGYFTFFWVRDRTVYEQYTNRPEGFAMKYPKGWKVIHYPESGASVV